MRRPLLVNHHRLCGTQVLGLPKARVAAACVTTPQLLNYAPATLESKLLELQEGFGLAKDEAVRLVVVSRHANRAAQAGIAEG